MRKNTLQNINEKKEDRKLKRVVTVILSCMLMVGVTGCVYKNKGDYLGEKMRTYDEQSDAMMQSIIDALETQDTEALRKLFSSE